MNEQPFLRDRPNMSPINDRGQPWNPRSFLALIGLFGVGALVALSINWGRLARGNRALPTLFIGLVLFAGIFLGPLLPYLAQLEPSSSRNIAVGVGFGVAFLLYLVGLFILQTKDYQDYLRYPQFRKQGRVSYAGTWAIIAYAVGMMSLVIFAMVVAYFRTRPETIETKYFTMTRLGHWERESTTTTEYCQRYSEGCLVYLESYGEKGDVAFTITYIPQDEPDFETAVDSQWDALLNGNRDIDMGRTHQETVGGILVTFQDFTARAHYVNGGYAPEDYFIGRGYVPMDGGLLEITYWAVTEGDFREHRSEYDELMDSIKFTQPVLESPTNG